MLKKLQAPIKNLSGRSGLEADNGNSFELLVRADNPDTGKPGAASGWIITVYTG